MESPDASERKWACVAVSNLIHNDPSTRRLLQGKNVVGALITRLTDNEDEVVTEAMGTLRCVHRLPARSDAYLHICRNLCIDGGFDICAEMYNKNILTPLKSFIPKVSSDQVSMCALAHIHQDFFHAVAIFGHAVYST